MTITDLETQALHRGTLLLSLCLLLLVIVVFPLLFLRAKEQLIELLQPTGNAKTVKLKSRGLKRVAGDIVSNNVKLIGVVWYNIVFIPFCAAVLLIMLFTVVYFVLLCSDNQSLALRVLKGIYMCVFAIAAYLPLQSIVFGISS